MEIERKWLIDAKHPPYPLEGSEVWRVEQAYLAFEPAIRIRSVNDERFFLNVKTLPPDCGAELIRREEFEVPIPRETYKKLLKNAEGTVIFKTRYRTKITADLTAETDIFHGELTGLAYLEIEFPDEKSARAFQNPPGILCDVSDDFSFTNVALARDGFPAEAKKYLAER